eukprot:1093105-Pyramimonas_sp.AAC.2
MLSISSRCAIRTRVQETIFRVIRPETAQPDDHDVTHTATEKSQRCSSGLNRNPNQILTRT